MKPAIADTLLLLAGLAWGLGFVAQETAMEDIGPALFVGLRFCLAALVTLPFAIVQYKNLQSTAEPKTGLLLRPTALASYFLLGLIFFAGMFLQQLGLVYTSVSKAGFLTGLYIVLVPFILHFCLGRPQHRLIWPSAAVCLAGIYMLNYAPVDSLNLGDYLIICCAFFWAIQVILVGRLAKKTRAAPMVIACIQFSVTGVAGLLAYALLADNSSFEKKLSIAEILPAAPEILYASIVAGAFAFSLQIIAQRYTSESRAAILLSSEALFATLFAAIILSETLSPQGYVGCALIFSAMLAIQLLPVAKPQTTETQTSESNVVTETP